MDLKWHYNNFVRTKLNLKYYFINKKRYDDDLSENDIKYLLKKQFKWRTGYELNFDNPRSFNEKLNWLKLYDHNPLMTICADKYKVRDYIKEKIGEEYLIPLIGVWDKPQDIDFDKLPNQFVLKVNWGSGQNIIVKDKSKLDIEDAKAKLSKWMKKESNHYYYSFEWCYKNIEPKIICEKYMEEMDGQLIDYKFFCFNGEPKFCYLGIDRFVDLKMNFYDMNWNLLPFKRFHPNFDITYAKPKKFCEMQAIAEKLARGFTQVRVDFYQIEEKIYIGEMTFFPGSGMRPFEPREWDYKIGDMLDLKKDN